MKKSKFLYIILAALTILPGCGSSEGKPDNLAQYVKLGNIENLGVEYVRTEITEEEMQEAIDSELEAVADYVDKDGPIEMGDMIDIRVKATSDDGEVLYDFSDDAYDMTLGEGEWGEAFDEYIVGKNVGDSGQVTYDYDEDFEDMVLCGHKVVLDYSIERVYNIVIPELNEESLSEMGFDSEDEFREYIKENLTEEHEYDDHETFVHDLLNAVIEGSEFSKIPSDVKKYARECVDAGYEDYADFMSCDTEDVYELLEVDEDDIEAEALEYAKELIVIDAIREKAGIVLDSSTYDKMLKDFMDEEEYGSMTEVYEDYEKSELEDYFMDELVKDYLVSVNS
ncbi:MAG: hypothetical protein K5929_01635 [Lachnospiraceae bacterium]|nr:hypothetical protein [Lachnospiraceae bacterium]